jgi:hypothetical protein
MKKKKHLSEHAEFEWNGAWYSSTKKPQGCTFAIAILCKKDELEFVQSHSHIALELPEKWKNEKAVFTKLVVDKCRSLFDKKTVSRVVQKSLVLIGATLMKSEVDNSVCFEFLVDLVDKNGRILDEGHTIAISGSIDGRWMDVELASSN